MARPRKKIRVLGIVATAVIAVAAAGYIVKERIIVGDTAGAADSTALDDSTVTKEDGKKKGKDGKEKKEDPPIPVEVARVDTRQMSSYYVTTATLQPEKKVDLLAKVGGQVKQILSEEGDRVKAGQLIARLDEREQKIALEEARIDRDQQKRELERLRSMHSQNLISEKEWSDVQHQFELANNRYESAELKFEYTQIRAPFDGVITERLVDEGENIAIGARLFVVADTDPLELTMYVPEAELGSITPGQTLLITPDVSPDEQFVGEITLVAPEVDQRTGTVKVTAQTKGGGIPGSFVRVRIVTDTRDGALAIPRRGLVADAGDHFVFVAEADTVRRVEVELGYEDEDYAEILDGVSAGDTVVTAGVGGIRQGTKVKILGKETAEDKKANEEQPIDAAKN